MIRKAVIVVLTLGAVTAAVIWVAAPEPPEFCLRDPGTGTTPRVQVMAGYRGFGRDLIIGYGVFLRDEPPGIQDIYGTDRWRLLGVSYDRYKSLPNPPIYVDGWAVGVPFWQVCVLLSAYPAVAFIRGPVRRWRRRLKGFCVECGYDLTGNVSGACPECGMKVANP